MIVPVRVSPVFLARQYETVPLFEPERVPGTIQLALGLTDQLTFASTMKDEHCAMFPWLRLVGFTRRNLADGGS